MFFPGIPNIFVPGDSVFMLFKCMCNNISIVKKEKKNENYLLAIKGVKFLSAWLQRQMNENWIFLSFLRGLKKTCQS